MKARKVSPKIRRLLSVYDKKTEKHVRDYELTNFKLREVQEIFKQPSDDPMYYCYQVTKNKAQYFREKYGRRFYFKKHEYFLECASIERKTKPIGRIRSLEFTKTKGKRTMRLLAVYKKKSDEHVCSYALPYFNIKEIRRAFGQKHGNKIYYVYSITDKEAPYFRKKYGRRFHFKNMEYFLETREY